MFNEFSESMLEIAFIITNNAMGRMGKEELITSFVQVLKEEDVYKRQIKHSTCL